MYSITYGPHDAPHELEVFFDVGCTRCSTFFLEDFPLIKQVWVDSEQLKVIFKPYPLHQETIVFMACCDGLAETHRNLFFEILMGIDKPTTDSICSVMEMLACPFQLETPSVLEEAARLTSAYQFDVLPMLFFDAWPVSEIDLDNLMCFLKAI